MTEMDLYRTAKQPDYAAMSRTSWTAIAWLIGVNGLVAISLIAVAM